jgi:hypothetical protein
MLYFHINHDSLCRNPDHRCQFLYRLAIEVIRSRMNDCFNRLLTCLLVFICVHVACAACLFKWGLTASQPWGMCHKANSCGLRVAVFPQCHNDGCLTLLLLLSIFLSSGNKLCFLWKETPRQPTHAKSLKNTKEGYGAGKIWHNAFNSFKLWLR